MPSGPPGTRSDHCARTCPRPRPEARVRDPADRGRGPDAGRLGSGAVRVPSRPRGLSTDRGAGPMLSGPQLRNPGAAMRPDPEKSPSVADTAALLPSAPGRPRRRLPGDPRRAPGARDRHPGGAARGSRWPVAGGRRGSRGGPGAPRARGGAGRRRHGGPRYFGFVIGGSLPAALAADWLTSTWDQNAGIYAAGPAASVVEEVVGAWLIDLFGLPGGNQLRADHGLPDGPCHLSRGGASPGACRPGLGRGGRRAGRCAGDRRPGGSRGARDDRHGAPVPGPGPRPGASSPTPTTRAGWSSTASRSACRPATGRSSCASRRAT